MSGLLDWLKTLVRRRAGSFRSATRARSSSGSYARAAGLGWQGQERHAHRPEPGLLYHPGRTRSEPRTAERRARGGSLRLVPPLPGSLPDRRVPSPRSPGRLALHRLLHDREQRPVSRREFRAGRRRLRLYGCDVCQEVCPWNRFEKPARALAAAGENRCRTAAFAGPRRRARPAESFRRLPRACPSRARQAPQDFLRNVLLAMGNSGDARFRSDPAASSPSDPDPTLLAEQARWSLARFPAEQC